MEEGTPKFTAWKHLLTAEPAQITNMNDKKRRTPDTRNLTRFALLSQPAAEGNILEDDWQPFQGHDTVPETHSSHLAYRRDHTAVAVHHGGTCRSIALPGRGFSIRCRLLLLFEVMKQVLNNKSNLWPRF